MHNFKHQWDTRTYNSKAKTIKQVWRKMENNKSGEDVEQLELI
jgi:hypothetical protein